MIARAQFVEQVMALVGQPVRHRGRRPGAGLDCVGVPIAAAAACGLDLVVDSTYGQIPSWGDLRAGLLRHCDEVPLDSRQPGDILAMFEGMDIRHVAVLVWPIDGRDCIVVARPGRGRVVMQSIHASDRISSCWRLRGIG
jgi:cell wall-associated NlpC family hydrolase